MTTRNPQEAPSTRDDPAGGEPGEPASDETPSLPVHRFSADSIADAALQQRLTVDGAQRVRCDACDRPIEGEPNGRGLFLWTRGDEHRFEEPALCEDCATAIGVTALASFTVEEEEG